MSLPPLVSYPVTLQYFLITNRQFALMCIYCYNNKLCEAVEYIKKMHGICNSSNRSGYSLFIPMDARVGYKLGYAISEKILCNLRCLKARLRLPCNKLSTAQQLEPRFKTVLSYVTFLFSKWRIRVR